MASIIYYGIPPTDNAPRIVRFIDGDDPSDHGRDLQPPAVGHSRSQMPFDWGYVELNGKPTRAMVPGATPLALSICCHALGSNDRGLALHQRFKLRVMDKWKAGEPWAISAEEVAAVADKIEGDELTPQQLRAIDRERPAPEIEGGRGVEGAIVWDTDEQGNWVKPRHGGE